ncbi:MAG: DNA starvation/stationary phase protection protein [Bdellovibrionales bacterium]|nr:DNA starvation/stationary phase protection protein [Bdellovibrionales bacterium]
MATMTAETIERGRVAEGLCHLLADTYTLSLRTQNYHWNVTGPMFQTLHIMFETQYADLALAVDEIAERIRSLGFSAPATYSEFAELSSISDGRGVPSAERMIEMLNDGHTAVALTAKNIFTATTESNDVSTADLLTRRITTHEKTAWMLRSLLM